MMADVMLASNDQLGHLPVAERAGRLAIVQEAMTWLRCPYHHQGRLKGVGVDCGMLLLEIYEALGLMPHVDPRPYPPDWHLHRSEQVYLGWVKQYARPVETPLPGDLVLYRFGRCISHGALVLDWPNVIHAYVDLGVVQGVHGEFPLESRRFAGAWSVFGGA